jgi:hypothetical protein
LGRDLWLHRARRRGIDRRLAADPRYPDWPCAQAKVPEISLAAVWAVRRSTTPRQVEGRRQGQRAGAALGRTAHAARGSQKAITEFLTGSRPKRPDRQAAVRRPVRYPQRPALVGHERARTRHPQAARAADKIRSDTLALQALQDASPPDQPRSMNSAISWSGKRASSRTGGV